MSEGEAQWFKLPHEWQSLPVSEISGWWTDLSLLQFGPVGFDVVHDAIVGSGQGHPSDQQDDEDHVGKGGREVHNLKHNHTIIKHTLLSLNPSVCQSFN